MEDIILKKHIISTVKNDSIAFQLGIEPSDVLISIDDKEITDIIDYMGKIATDYLELLIQKLNGELFIFEIEKEYYEDLGIVFEDRMLDVEKNCANKCMFCFVDQLPDNMRKTLYFKDDDWRLSFLMGNYVTLTNISELELERIVSEKISPLYVSVHSTDKAIRQKMMGYKSQMDLANILRRFKEEEIRLHCQVVVCPEINDGTALEETINELSSFWPSVQSVAVVPVGLTKHRQKLALLKPFDTDSSRALIDLIEDRQTGFKKMYGVNFVYAADEFYIMSERQLPEFEAYDDFPQLENGVGLIRKLKCEFDEAIETHDSAFNSLDVLSIATGLSAYPTIKELTDKAAELYNIKASVYPIRNDFFGDKITVAGLVTGQDLIEQLQDKELGKKLIIPYTMLRAEGDLFLDDLSIDDVANALSVTVIPVPISGSSFLEILLKGIE